METAHNDLPLTIRDLGFRYQRRKELAISNISFDLRKGEIILLAGTSGCGKTTLMRCINGLAPNIYQGEIHGEILLFGKDVQKLKMAELSQTVGTLLQDPERQIVASHVFNEVAFGLENLGMPRQRIVYRVDETLEYLGISGLRDQETFHLSGGEKQKVALAGILAMHPKVMLLDEPLASLDSASSAEALQIFKKLAQDGISIILVEHRVEDVLAIQPDRTIFMNEGTIAYNGETEAFLSWIDRPVVKLPAEIMFKLAQSSNSPEPVSPTIVKSDDEIIQFDHVHFQYSPETQAVLCDINLSVRQGDVIALLGPNGAGKTTLVKHMLGLLKPTKGHVRVNGTPTTQTSIAEVAKTVGYVFQSPMQMLFAETVEEELRFGPKNLQMPAHEIDASVEWAVETVHLVEERKSPPLGLSFGQQKRVSIASILAMRSKVLIMDEPTAGQDYWNYVSFMDAIVTLPGFCAIIFITHDLDLALMYANRVIILKEGMVLGDGVPADVLTDFSRLRSARILPTSLLQLNLRFLPQTGKMMRVEALAKSGFSF